jgi:DNA polymerase III delta prime subunit
MLQLNKLWQTGRLPCSTLIGGEVESACLAVTAFISEIVSLNSSDVLIVEPKEQRAIGINQIRELNRWANETAEIYKFALIKEADKMTFAAANACLKTLEEPAKARFFFLITANPKALPKTLVSRCQVMWHKSEEGAEKYKKLVNVVASNNKETLAQFLTESSSFPALLVSSWIKSRATSFATSGTMEKAARLQALARHYSSLALDARHISAILLHELLCGS